MLRLGGFNFKIERSITAPEVGVNDNGPDFHYEWLMRIRTRMMVDDVVDDHGYDSQQIMRIRYSIDRTTEFTIFIYCTNKPTVSQIMPFLC